MILELAALKFKDGTMPSIDRFYQRTTYYGLIEGVPNTAINAEKIESIKGEAERFLGLKKIHLISPKETIHDPTPLSFYSEKNVFKASLPSILCIAELSHYKPMHDDDKECSQLGLIWFQDQYAYPISEDVLEQIGTLEWGKLSSDEYL